MDIQTAAVEQQGPRGPRRAREDRPAKPGKFFIIENLTSGMVGLPWPDETEGKMGLTLAPAEAKVVRRPDIWDTSQDLARFCDKGLLRTYWTDTLPKARQSLPSDLEPPEPVLRQVAREIAYSTNDELTLDLINMQPAQEGGALDTGYLKDKHYKTLKAGLWLLKHTTDRESERSVSRIEAIERRMEVIRTLGYGMAE